MIGLFDNCREFTYTGKPFIACLGFKKKQISDATFNGILPWFEVPFKEYTKHLSNQNCFDSGILTGGEYSKYTLDEINSDPALYKSYTKCYEALQEYL
jgi:hypothetical protein